MNANFKLFAFAAALGEFLPSQENFVGNFQSFVEAERAWSRIKGTAAPPVVGDGYSTSFFTTAVVLDEAAGARAALE